MNLLVTAGNTLVPIDRVRGITNVFTGRTGAGIARCAADRGHAVQLLTSHPETAGAARPGASSLVVLPYKTFDDLGSAMQQAVTAGSLDAIIHCAAVSDYRSAGVYAPAPGTTFDTSACRWRSEAGSPTLTDRAAAKVKSDEPELWLRLVRTPKLIDRIRPEWGFRGVLVKFKLEVGVNESLLQKVAERSRRHSDADLIVANTLEGSQEWALLGPIGGCYVRIARPELPGRLLTEVERLHRERTHG